MNDIPAVGDWLAFDILGERAGRDARQGWCRPGLPQSVPASRRPRVVDGVQGHCKGALVCPFHGWVYNLDGTLRGPARPEPLATWTAPKFNLKPVEMEIWHGFIFLRFLPGPQPALSELLCNSMMRISAISVPMSFARACAGLEHDTARQLEVGSRR